MWPLSGKFSSIVLPLLVMLSVCARGQEMPFHNQYFSDYSFICHAFTGKENCYAAGFADQHQWMGIENAPNTQLVFANARLNPGKRAVRNYHGLGAIAGRDNNGPYGEMGLSLTYSFHVLLSDARKVYLSMALSPSVSQQSLSQRTFLNFNSDPLITGERQSAWNPNAGISASVYNPDFFAGLSAINILPKINFLTNPAASERMIISYFAIAGYRFRNTRNILMFEPSAVFGVKELYTKQLDLNLKVFYKNIMWSGISYRHNLDALPGKTINILPSIGVFIKNLQVSYAFDLGFKGLQNQSFGSHYLYLGWGLCKESMKMVPCPAYD